ncbi:MAG TPA: glycosyltransferase family 9 protein [Chloroflexota bacterium]
MRATPKRILVVKLATLGDLLIATPALRALRTTFPDAHIGVLTTAAGSAALRGLDSLDELLVFDKYAFDRPSEALANVPHALELARHLRGGDWDVLVLMHHLTTAFGIAKYAALCLGSGAPVRVGLDNGRGWFLTQRAEDRGFGWRHEVDYLLDVVGVLGARHPDEPRLELCISADDEAWAAQCWADLDITGEAILINAGSGAYSTARRWAPERFVETARALHARHGLQPLVLAGLSPDEQLLARRVASGVGGKVVPAAPTPQALGALIQKCRLVVANDSGPVHLATAVGTPVVAIFGPSNDKAWGPYPVKAQQNQVAREILACAPCIHRGHSFGTPQGCPARTCLAILETATVLDAAERALGVDARVLVRT